MKNIHLLHIAEATGNARRSPRSMVPDEAIEKLRPILVAALVEAVPVPGCEGYSFRAWEADGRLRVQVLSIDGAIVSLVVSRGTPEAAPRCRCEPLRCVSPSRPCGRWMRGFEQRIAWCWLEDR